ncbi:hypothetical protein Goari_003111, partial [Gossypium aridum]|nr:hypothetical protein [Gossypium aridum]
FISSFDFDTEQFGIVPPPHHFQELDKYSSECTKTGVLGGCLFIIHFTISLKFVIWDMKEYGAKESWTKQFVIEYLEHSKRNGYYSYQPMVVLSNGDTLMLYNNGVIVCCNQKRKHLRRTKLIQTRSCFNTIAYTCALFLSIMLQKES